MTNNDRALSSAQFMHDRAMPPVDAQDDAYDLWSNSLEGEMWRDETICRLLAGEAVYATENWGVRDRQAVLEHVQHLAGRPWVSLDSGEKLVVEAWHDYCDAVASEWLASRWGKADHDLWVLKNSAEKELSAHLVIFAEQKVNAFERDFFDKYVWGAK